MVKPGKPTSPSSPRFLTIASRCARSSPSPRISKRAPRRCRTSANALMKRREILLLHEPSHPQYHRRLPWGEPRVIERSLHWESISAFITGL